MALKDVVLLAIAIVLVAGWGREAFRRTDAEQLAAQRDSVASAALESASSFQAQRDSAIALADDARLAFEDSLVVWAARARSADARARAAIDSAGTLRASLAASLDSVQAELLVEIQVQHEIEVEAARESGREEGRQQASVALAPRITALEEALLASRQETRDVRIAERARAEAEEALASELRRQRTVGWVWKVAAASGWVVAALR